MDPFIMKTVGEEWARDRQQRRQERALERQHAADPSDIQIFGRSLWTRFSERVRVRTWLPRRHRRGVRRPA